VKKALQTSVEKTVNALNASVERTVESLNKNAEASHSSIIGNQFTPELCKHIFYLFYYYLSEASSAVIGQQKELLLAMPTALARSLEASITPVITAAVKSAVEQQLASISKLGADTNKAVPQPSVQSSPKPEPTPAEIAFKEVQVFVKSKDYQNAFATALKASGFEEVLLVSLLKLLKSEVVFAGAPFTHDMLVSILTFTCQHLERETALKVNHALQRKRF